MDNNTGKRDIQSEKKYYGTSSSNSSPSTSPSDQRVFEKKTFKKRKPSNLGKGITILIIAALLIALFYTPYFSSLTDFWGGPVYPEEAEFTIERTLNISSSKDIRYTIELPIPPEIEENNLQQVQSVEWTGETEAETFEKYNHTWKRWEDEGSGQMSFQIEYSVKTRTLNWDYSSDDSGKVEDISEDLKETYNRNQWQLDEDRNNDGELDWMIQPEHPEVRSLAEDIVEGKDNIYDKARAIYDWINNNIGYDRGATGELPKHPVWVLETEFGDCDEQAYLFCSLARAVDIPAWIELGVLYDRVIDNWGGHGWVRMNFVDSNGHSTWVNIDTVNNQFFSRGANRITTWIDDGEEGHLSGYYQFINYSYQGSPPQISFSEGFKNTYMETDGQVYLTDGEKIPGFEISLLISSIIIAVFIYRKKKYKN